ncbi:hydantoinase/oxoprolinase family protein [Brevibacillus humidisoli]|uniref:hydantoinase/oxoprolinase family protein n=1 Tax=Brevibacillus humidisoli TaxID=2895522 RepID=UPI001E4B75FF|nr:hydantoinase/oxoprolinase family protein [Brevibacillus humidisoli]UFJ40766.1 hydantoinase/oxoprolinase family protein [Brevibacillus humidisoli]
MKLGIDVGGTNTDAVIISNEGRLIGEAKQATTFDILTGIRRAAGGVIREVSLDPRHIQGIFVGTTHVLNALYYGKGLTDTALIRICPHPSKMRAGEGWPEILKRRIKLTEQVAGGYELDGSRQKEIDFFEKRQALITRLAESGCRAVAIVGTFSPLYQQEEQMLAAIIQEALPDLSISLSHQIGSMGYLERENATLLNAMLSNVMQSAINGLSGMFEELGFHCPYWFVQNDGSLMSLEMAASFPILTIGSGVANSLRGASYLTGLRDCVVVDMGGSTTEVGLVTGGEPQELTRDVNVMGIRMNVRLPKATSLPFGGESRIVFVEGQPTFEAMLSHRQQQEQQIDERGCTLTDVFLQLNPLAFGYRYERDPAAEQLSRRETEQVVKHATDQLRQTIDRVQPAKEKLPVVLVGGGSPLLVDRLFNKYGETIHPAGFQISNAVGACMAPVSSQIDRIYWLNNRSKEAVLDVVKQEVIEEVERSGGIKETIRLVQVEEIPFDYYKGEVIRFRLKAVGQLRL